MPYLSSRSFYVPGFLLPVFLETVGFVIFFDAVGPQVENSVVGVALSSQVAEPAIGVVAFVTVESEVVLVLDPGVYESGIVFVAVLPVDDVAGPQASADNALSFGLLLPVSVVAAEVDSYGHPRFVSFPNVFYHANSASSFEVFDEESAHSSTGVRTNDGLCNILSNPGPRHNKKREHH
jgi:hypothetical protein